MNLSVIFRQRDPAFTALLAEVRAGRCSGATLALLRGRVGIRPPEGHVATKLRARCREVDAINASAFDALCGEVREFAAQDEGPEAAQLVCPAPALLRLRVGCVVLLLKNVDVASGLCNGAQGTVQGFATEAEGGHPLVAFGDGKPRPIAPAQWTCMWGRRLAARRTQIPLTLAYAMTIHRAQGMQLECLDLSTAGVFEAAQVYVGLSRATSLEGVYLTEFDPRKVRARGASMRFYSQR